MKESWGVVTASRLNLRPEPSTQRPPVASLPRGARIELLERLGSWYRIRSGELEGYVHGDFVRLLESEPAAGFLRERPELAAVALEAPEDRRLKARPAASARERQLARTWNRAGGLLAALAELVQMDPGVALAVLSVESSGAGLLGGRMTIRFENHVFWREWGKANEAAFDAHFRFDSARPWTGHVFRPEPGAPWRSVHGDQEAEWRVFEFAAKLSEAAAKRSISMGAAQIMGFNFARIGYDSVLAMFDAFAAGLRAQIVGLFDFIKGPGTDSALLEALRRGKFAEFAAGYNGPALAAQYAARLERDLELFRRLARS